MPPSPTAYRPDPRVLALGEGFLDPVAPARFPAHTLRVRNQRWASRVGLGALSEAEWLAHFARFEPLPANLAAPLAWRYHGHQFGVYNPQLGDGRGFLFAQLRDAADGRLLDLGTKGTGTTPYSRGGDGRLTLKGGVREVLATEMLEALGVYTSKSFSLVETGESLVRHDEPSPTRGAALVRLSHSHVRFGTFQRHAFHADAPRVRRLLEFCAEHYLPELAAAGEPGPAGEGLPAALLRAVARRAAELCASWMVAGFVHGVLNTDNMNVTGESFDYGPYRFLPAYDPGFTAAYFDDAGLFAFGRQPDAVYWNVTRLAAALALVCEGGSLAPPLAEFQHALIEGVHRRFLERLGLRPRGHDADEALVEAAFGFLAETRVGYDRFFFDWHGGVASEARALAGPEAAAYRGAAGQALRRALEHFEPARSDALAEPYFQRAAPCALLHDEIEALWAPIEARDDWGAFDAKVAEIRAMGAAYGRGAPAVP